MEELKFMLRMARQNKRFALIAITFDLTIGGVGAVLVYYFLHVQGAPVSVTGILIGAVALYVASIITLACTIGARRWGYIPQEERW